MIRVTVWNENVQEQRDDGTARRILMIHPGGIHETLRGIFAAQEDMAVIVRTMDMPECGLDDKTLENTDVLVWWAHVKHDELPDSIAMRVRNHVLRGMGLIALHSAHPSKPMQLLLGTSGSLDWRDDDFCRVWTVKPSHPIAKGIPAYIELSPEEMYAEPFDISTPDEIVFMSWFRSGCLFRSGCTWTRGYGKIFYFQPGHEVNTAYQNPNIRQILVNAARWAQPTAQRPNLDCHHVDVTPEEKCR